MGLTAMNTNRTIREVAMEGTTNNRSPRRIGRLLTTLLATGMMLGAIAPGLPALAQGYVPANDVYSMDNTTEFSGAQDWWDAGYTGEGIDVAVIDTGVSPIPGLDGPDKIIYGPDLSLESQNPELRHFDTNGHGTFMAGLIAGKDAGLTQPYSQAPASVYRGMAPDARIVSLKVGVADGGVDVSQVIAAINWVIEHKNDNGLNIRVLNLAYGTNSLQSYDVDPLSYAVEQAWNNGIVVVAAAGNTGYQRGNDAPGLANPAYNPFVIGVGGYSTNGTPQPNDDYMGDYSASSAACGSRCKNPDFVAIGSHLQGLRVPNSFIDVNYPSGRLGERYFRGSGTSEAAAVTSGAVALILQKHPELTPDQIKRFIGNEAKKIGGADSQAQGKGELRLGVMLGKNPPNYNQDHNPSTGTGSLNLARGSDHISLDGVLLTGEQDIFGNPFDSAVVAQATAQGTSWSNGEWNGTSWSGTSWSGTSWSGTSWSGTSWSGTSWSGTSWSGTSWSGLSWSGTSWSGTSWSGTSWSGTSWSGTSWSGDAWSTGGWY
jgi:serine protease AprX